MPGQFLNDPHPWTEGVHADLSLVDLVANGTIPASPAALLWWAMERGAALVTAGGPSGAGKTTLANALLAFLPDGAGIYAVAGAEDKLELPSHDGRTYLLISELSDHPRPFYIAGDPARRVFSLVADGRGLVGTLHADSVAEALDVLAVEVGLRPGHITRVDLIAVSRVENEAEVVQPGKFRRIPSDAVVERRIIEIGLVVAGLDGVPAHLTLAAWNEASCELEMANPPAGLAALAKRLGVPLEQAEIEIAARAEVLSDLAEQGRREPTHVEAEARRLRGT
jgi:energy-coupling factor transporter ATP-binding protein EcfA2